MGKFWRAFEWKTLVYSMGIWNILWPFWHILWLVGNLVAIWYIFTVLVYCVKKHLATLALTIHFRERVKYQGDQIGWIFAKRLIVYSGQFFL
jgi:hypothetical protein